jgi:hypothetical protein
LPLHIFFNIEKEENKIGWKYETAFYSDETPQLLPPREKIQYISRMLYFIKYTETCGPWHYYSCIVFSLFCETSTADRKAANSIFLTDLDIFGALGFV